MTALLLAAALAGAAAAASYDAPSYSNPEAYSETSTLAVPKGAGPFPGVVLVGKGRAYRDLAVGLASRGVLVARCEQAERREAALGLLRKRADVDPARVFLVQRVSGAPKDTDLAGIVVLAPSGRDSAATFRALRPRGAARVKVYRGLEAILAAEESPPLELVSDLFNWIFKGRL